MHRGPFTFVTAIQDETHRFAITYQRKNAGKRAFASSLTAIPGIGPATAKALMAHFKTGRAISQPEAQALAEAKGVSRSAAQNLYSHYHPQQLWPKGQEPIISIPIR